MDNKEYLQNYARQRAIIAMYEDTKATALKDLAKLPEKPKYNQTGILQHKLKKQLQETIETCDARSAEARRKCREIQAAIDGVTEPRQRAILQMRYIQDPPETWERIAYKLGYSFEHCHNLHRQALENIRT